MSVFDAGRKIRVNRPLNSSRVEPCHGIHDNYVKPLIVWGVIYDFGALLVIRCNMLVRGVVRCVNLFTLANLRSD